MIFHNGSALIIVIAVMCVVCLQDGTVAVWKMKSPTDITLRMTLKTDEREVSAVELSDSETTIISGLADKAIKVYSRVCCNYMQQEMFSTHM